MDDYLQSTVLLVFNHSSMSQPKLWFSSTLLVKIAPWRNGGFIYLQELEEPFFQAMTRLVNFDYD